MQKIISLFMGVFALAFLGSCATNTISDSQIKREWMLVEFQDFSKEMLTKNKASINLTPQEGNANAKQYAAFMGCNRMFFTGNFKSDGTAELSQMGSTMMFCQESMDLESAFGKVFPTMTNYKIDGHYLTLTNKNGDTMKFVAADWD